MVEQPRPRPGVRWKAPAGSELASLRMQAHLALDVHWQFEANRGGARAGAYAWLAEQMGLPFEHCHMGMFDEEQCRQAIAVCAAGRPPRYDPTRPRWNGDLQVKGPC